MTTRYMKLWAAGAFLVVLSLAVLVGCEDAGAGGGGDGGVTNVDPIGTWLVVLSEPSEEGPSGTDFQAALVEINETQFSIIFYGNDTAQVAGLKGSYEVNGDTVDCVMNIGWFPEDPEDPEDPDAPELVSDGWTNIDWYEVVPSDAMEQSVTIEGSTLYGGQNGEIEFNKVSFGRPAELVDTWIIGDDNLVLNGGGSFTYTWDTQSGGGPLWAVTPTEGYMRQVYDDISDEENLNYIEYLSPYEMIEADTLRLYEAYNLTGEYDYRRS
jgi:hypothetical protein